MDTIKELICEASEGQRELSHVPWDRKTPLKQPSQRLFFALKVTCPFPVLNTTYCKNRGDKLKY